MSLSDLEKLETLISDLEKTSLASAELKYGEISLHLTFRDKTKAANPTASNSGVSPSTSLSSDTSTVQFITSPGMGLFTSSHPLINYEHVNHFVTQGQVLGYLKFEEVLTEIVSPQAGKINATLVAENALVGYGDKIYSIS
ncbi:hypothetical protein ACF2G4_22645 (plasmid) [Pantoea sp. C3]|uniref:hypothetical protein n=1 Tax=Pantoea phytostimulans TaxID=2769024 RepID=UPI0038F8188B